ncbi:ABC transporter ATP-binding protein [Pseudonocardia sichuanensis]|uniref:Carbohydrate ABC transporter ATP-binding protein (CUT1 family) n=1 Tax=Pseudonocardia kunmingensis TaxID=630975 RepID=A0A543DQG4_9PSEU|nr:ABC transporter ATP-binding protein [Pseudonocardia kunmingensis]TQM11566.1 carbohydrate ABC transporter ATP-binding protein (CUT1 family) [Pseudonocardia kunmingensis]
MARIQIEGLGKQFGATTAVDAVDLTVEDGEFVALLGPSGCGKTTLLRMLAGLSAPSAGRILLNGTDITHASPKDRDLAMVFQSYALYPHLTVAGNLSYPLRSSRVPRARVAEQVAAVAEQLALTPFLSRRPKELSGGQRQRVAVGRAMVRNPAAFLMDEPLSNLDAKLRTATRTELAALHRRLGATFVYVTHDQVEAMTMASRIVVMDGGRVEQVGTPEEVYDSPASVFVATFLGAPPMNVLPATVTSADGRVRADGDGIRAELWPGQTPPHEVVVGVRPEHLVRRGPDGVDAGILLDARVEAVENLGSEEVAQCRVGDTPVAVRGPRPLRLAVGDQVSLTCSLADLHLFDATTRRRLRWVDEPAERTVAVG